MFFNCQYFIHNTSTAGRILTVICNYDIWLPQGTGLRRNNFFNLDICNHTFSKRAPQGVIFFCISTCTISQNFDELGFLFHELLARKQKFENLKTPKFQKRNHVLTVNRKGFDKSCFVAIGKWISFPTVTSTTADTGASCLSGLTNMN